MHQVAREILPRCRGEIARATLARVDLEQLERSIALVVFQVEIREAHVADFLQETPDAGVDVFVVARHNGTVAANAQRRMLFQHHIAQALHGHAARAVAIAVHHAHARIVAGNKVLHNHGVIVAR